MRYRCIFIFDHSMEHVAKAIGYVVYAVASADNHVSPEEKKTIHEIINEHWTILSDSEDPFGARALDFIDKMVLVLEEKHIDSEFAFDQFKEVYEVYKPEFTTDLRKFILDVCIKTGSAFNRMNKSELVLLSRIEQLLKMD